MMSTEMKLSPPWETWFSEIQMLFRQDPDIECTRLGCSDPTLKLRVNNQTKARALEKMIPAEKDFGGVIARVMIVPANVDEMTPIELLRTAFKGNKAVSRIESVNSPFGTVIYTVFRPDVVQFFNDNMADINGNKTTLYEEIARDVFDGGLVIGNYCTEAVNPNLEKPLGEWPDDPKECKF